MQAQFKVVVVAALLSLASEVVAQPMEEGRAEACPPSVRGVEMSVEQISGGVVLEFTTDERAQHTELRRLLRAASAMVEYHSKVAELRSGRMFTREGIPIPAVDIDVKSTGQGARITIHADDPKDADVVVEHARSFKEFWDGNACVRGIATKKI